MYKDLYGMYYNNNIKKEKDTYITIKGDQFHR